MNTHSLSQAHTLGAAVLLLAVCSCADEPLTAGDAPDSLQTLERAATAAPSVARPPPPREDPAHPWPAVTLTDPDVTVKVSAQASGTACTKNDVFVMWSKNGSLRVDYNENELFNDGTKRVARRACDSSFSFASSVPVQFAVKNLGAQGYSYLESGVTGSAAYRLDVGGQEVLETRADFAGPRDAKFRIDAAPPELHWSTCSRSGLLRLHNVFEVASGEARRAGYVDMCAVDAGDYDAHFDLELAWRACEL